MSFSEVQKVIETWPQDDQDRLAAFLTVLRLKRDPAFMEEMDRRLKDKDSANWMTLHDVKGRLSD